MVHRYGEHRPALAGLDLVVEAGEVVAIVGPSGSGKSTLLHCCAGLERPLEGTLSVCGVDVGSAPPAELRALRRRRLGFVYQDGQLLPELDVLRNVALPPRLAGKRRRRAERMAADALESLGLLDLAARRIGELSGGQLQRVAVARAVVNRPALVLADEPTGALDSANRDAVIQVLLDAVSSAGSSMLMVTHDASTAARCDRQVELVDGQIRSR